MHGPETRPMAAPYRPSIRPMIANPSLAVFAAGCSQTRLVIRNILVSLAAKESAASRVVSCAGAMANTQLTSHLNHSLGADHMRGTILGVSRPVQPHLDCLTVFKGRQF
jgi:hypothetical protein